MRNKLFVKCLSCIGFYILSFCPIVQSEEIPHHQIIVAGSGLSGLISAFYLKDYDIQVLESYTEAGGFRASTSYYQMFAYSHSMVFPDKPKGVMRDIADQLNLAPVQVPTPAFSCYYSGIDYYPSVSGITALLNEHSQPGEFDAFVQTVSSACQNYKEIPFYTPDSPIAELDALSVKSWFEKEKLPAFYLEYFNGMIRGLFNASAEEISAMSFLRILGQIFCSNENSIDGTLYYTFPNEMKDLLTPLTAALQDKILYRKSILNIKREGSLMAVEYKDENGISHKVTADAVISSISAKGTISLVSGCMSAEQNDILSKAVTTSSLRTFLKVAKPSIPTGGEFFYPNNFFFTLLYHRTGMIPPKLLGAPHQFYCYIPPQSAASSTIMSLPDTEILEKTVNDAEKIAPLIRSSIMESTITRYSNSHPFLNTGAYQRMARFNDLQGNGLYFANDYFTSPTLEGAIDAGYVAAAKVKKVLASSSHQSILYK